MTTTRRSPITTHVLDTSRGKAAAGVPVTLEAQTASGDWKTLKTSATNADGRVEDLLPEGTTVSTGNYRLTFKTQEYYKGLNTRTFYPFVSVVFEITQPGEHHHVPLLVNPFGYSTYRGT